MAKSILVRFAVRRSPCYRTLSRAVRNACAFSVRCEQCLWSIAVPLCPSRAATWASGTMLARESVANPWPYPYSVSFAPVFFRSRAISMNVPMDWPESIRHDGKDLLLHREPGAPGQQQKARPPSTRRLTQKGAGTASGYGCSTTEQSRRSDHAGRATALTLLKCRKSGHKGGLRYLQ